MKRFFIVSFIFIVSLSFAKEVKAAPVYDNTNGTYTDDFSDGTGMSSMSNMTVSGGTLRVIDGTQDGMAVTNVIMPQKISKWGTLTLHYQNFDPSYNNGNFVVCVLDEQNRNFPPKMFQCVKSPIDDAVSSSGSVDLSTIYPDFSISGNTDAKLGRIKIEVEWQPSINTIIQPVISIDNLTVTWTPQSGDLSASPEASSSWSSKDANQYNTRHSTGYMDYPTIKWGADFSYSGTDNNDVYNVANYSYASDVYMVRGSGDIIYVKNTGAGSGLPDNERTILAPFNRNTGYRLNQVLTTAPSASSYWLREIGDGMTGLNLTLSQNGTLYTEDIYNDTLSAYDSYDGGIKWIYAFGGGHDNSDVNIGDDGTIYTVRTDYPEPVVYAFNPDGSVKWNAYPIGMSTSAILQNITIGTNGNIYFGPSTETGVSTGVYTNQGALYALNPSTGATVWSYPTGDIGHIRPVVDTDGTIYTANSEAISTPKNIFALNPDGSLKWQYSIGTSTSYWNNLSLRSDGILLAERVITTYPTPGGEIDAINTSNGSLLWSLPLNSNNDVWTSQVFSDSENDFIIRSTVYRSTTTLSQYDPNHNLKWTLSQNNGDYAFLGDSMQDEDGSIYTAYIDSTANTTKIFALAPWTFTSTIYKNGVVSEDFLPEETMNFSISTPMQATNLISGATNQMQLISDKGDKIPLSYSTSASDGNAVWTGSYQIPISTTIGSHTYTLQAAQAGIQTDIPTNFVSAPIGSNNTGLTNLITFTIDNPIPITTSISPTSITAGGGDFTLTADGTNFVASSTVNWNNVPLATIYVSSTELTATVPATNLTTAGTASVTVANPPPRGGTSSSQTFTVNPTSSTTSGGGYVSSSYTPPPTISSTTPCQPGELFSSTTGLPCTISGTALTVPISDIQKVTKTLKLGMTNKNVKTLELFLIAQDKGPAAEALTKHGATTYFGKLTKNSLIEWQKAEGLTPDGIFGPKTRGKIKLLNL